MGWDGYLGGLQVRRVDLDGMSFAEQFIAVQEADIILAMHGAGLCNPATFGREKLVIVEIMPFNILHPMYYHKTVSSGMTYLMHQCRQGHPQPNDEKYAHLSVSHCFRLKECKQYFNQHRGVELTKKDVVDMEMVLQLAKRFASDARISLQTAASRLKGSFDTLCVSHNVMVECRQTFVHSPHADEYWPCVLSQKCKR